MEPELATAGMASWGWPAQGRWFPGLVAAESNREVRRDETRRDGAALSLGLLCRRDALLYVYMCVCMRAARLLYFCCAAAGASAGVWYGQNFLLLVRRFSLRM
jgi:hypothetical protein